jgi:hypothetical protein
MQALRRVTAIVLNVLLIQVSLAGYGATCAKHGDATGSRTSAAMAMTHVPDVSPGAERACADAVTSAGCSLPCTPGRCAAMTACVAPALPARATAPGVVASPNERAWGDPALSRQGLRPPPDLPPPRA